MRNKKLFKKLREWIQDNFFGLIIFLVTVLIIFLIVSLFIPISVEHVPNTSAALEQYNAGVEQRTILVRSVSSIISGISVVIAFVSLLQSKNSEVKRERLQIMPFPAYAVPFESIQDSGRMSPELVIKKESSSADTIVQTEFNITIKNIGLGSLVDYEIKEAFFKDSNGKKHDLNLSFFGHFILGKEETIRMVIDLTADFTLAETAQPRNLEAILIVVSFKDLLGNDYEQEFTIESKVRSVSQDSIPKADGTSQTRILYALNPKKISHTHPIEQ